MAVITNTALETSLANQRNTLKADRLDMSFGEIMHLYEDDNLIINPEFQRAFRWPIEYRTKFIESILIGIPIPPIFVAEDTDNRWELVDGLQRISSILSFFGELKNDIKGNNNYPLTKGDLISELEGLRHQDLPIRFVNMIKRAVCRVEILRWDSSTDLRYEVFTRLNKYGTTLKAQELRNAIFRGADERIFSLIKTLSEEPVFIRLIGLTDTKKDELFDQEMVLRYFFYQYAQGIKESKDFYQEQLDDFVRQLTKQIIKIDFVEAQERFLKDFEFIINHFGESVFKRANNRIFYPAIFDAFSYIIATYRSSVESDPSPCVQILSDLKKKEGEFRSIRVSGQRVSPTLKYLDQKVKEAYGL